MENNKYLNKVIGSLVRSTKMNYEKERIYFSFYPYPFHFLDSFLSSSLFSSFSKYCKNTFGLTKYEIDYVWNEYIYIIKDKIENGQ